MVKTGNGTLILASSNNVNNGTDAAMFLQAGTLVVTNTGTLGNPTAGVFFAMNGGALDLGTTTQAVGGFTVNDGTVSNGAISNSGTYNVAAGTIAAALTGASANLTKTGSGTATLSGNNSYGGTTTVTAGLLIVNGNQSAALGILDISSGATLGGSGTIGGATSISGIHSPGNSAAVQTFANGLTYATGSTFVWELFGNTADPADRGALFDGVDVAGGTLTINSGGVTSLVFNGSGSTVLWSDSFWDSDQTWQVFDNANAPSILGISSITIGFDSLGSDFAVARAGSSFEWDLQGNDIYLNYAVPEPSTYALLALAAAGLGAHVVRRRRNNRLGGTLTATTLTP